MKIAILPMAACTLFWGSTLWAQQAPAVAVVSEVVPFARMGAVTASAAVVEPTPAAKSDSEASGEMTAVIQAGGQISTGAEGASSLVLGRLGTARMGADSEVKVPAQKETGHSLELLKGKLFMNISGGELKERAGSEFKLKTPAALLAVKGTRFFAISANAADVIGVHEGSVEVMEPTSGKSVMVEAGNAVSVSPGILGEVRALSDTEIKLAQEYDLASLKAVPLPSIAYFRDKNLAVTYRDGRVTSLMQSAVNFRTLDAHLWWYYWWGTKGGRPFPLKVTDQGSIRYEWEGTLKDRNNDQLNLKFRGRRLEKFKGDTQAPPLLQVAALRFKYRAENIATLRLGLTGTHEYEIMNGHGSYRSSSKASEHLIQLAAGDEWREMVVPVPRGDYHIPQSKTQPPNQDDFAADDITIESIPPPNTAAKGSNKVISVLEMKDFELLIVP